MRNQQQPQQPTTTVVVQQSPGTSGLAIAGLIFSVLGLISFGLLSIPGVLLSFMALFSRGPKGVAIAGLIVGFPGVLFFAIVGLGFIAVILGFGAAANEAMKQAERRANQPQPAVEEDVETAAAPDVGKFILIAAKNEGDSSYPSFYAKDATRSEITLHALELRRRMESKPKRFILAEYFDNEAGKGTQVARFLHDYHTTTPTMDHNLLAFRDDVPIGEALSGEAAQLIADSVPLQTEEPSSDELEFPDPRTLADEDDLIKKREDEQRAQEEAERQQREAEEARLKAEEDAKFRVWTSTNGKKSPEAKIMSYSNGVVTIETRAGKKAKVPLDKLSDADKEYIAKWRKER
jgi:hypothetical protein